MFLFLPTGENGYYWFRDPLSLAESIFKLAAHEWRHIKDMQKNKEFGEYNRNWKNRPHEKRAEKSKQIAASKIEKVSDYQDAIITLGIEIERLWAKHIKRSKKLEEMYK